MNATPRALLAALRAACAWERLPPPPERVPSVPRAAGILRALFAPEPLPRDPELPRRRRRGWLHWLFALEPLDEEP